MKSCFMFGHSDCPYSILPKIAEAIELYYMQYDVTDFYVGNRGVFDSLATTAVKQAKQHHRDIRLYLLLAYHPAERSVDLTPGFDGSYYPPIENTPRPYAIVKANQHMIDTSDFIICYANHIGNARNLLEHARRKSRVRIENVAADALPEEAFSSKDLSPTQTLR